MDNYEIRDIKLAPLGHQKINWAKDNMPVLNSLLKDYQDEKPFEGVKISLSVHLEAKTAYLCMVLAELGADMSVTGSNVLSTQDDICAALANIGMKVYAWHDATAAEYERHIEKALEFGPNIIIDDGGDLVNMIHTKRQDLLGNIWGGCEETTTGVIRLRAMEKDQALKIPMIAVNDAKCKYLFDNRYGTGQSTWDSIMRNTNLIIAGKKVVVSGYGWCGRGIAMRAQGLGARVYITEVDSVRAIEAVMDGFEVVKMKDAAKFGDIFVTATGCHHIITTEHMLSMKEGVILANAGHFNVEIDMAGLEKMQIEKKEMRKNIMGYKLPNGKWVNVIGDGRLVNIAAADGHPVEIMDMSFGVQILGAMYILNNKEKLENKVISVTGEIDDQVSTRKLHAWGVEIDSLTSEQEKYLDSWNL
ncbi:MAG: adenosylhomocysteinase [Eubacteriales bacterium]